MNCCTEKQNKMKNKIKKLPIYSKTFITPDLSPLTIHLKGKSINANAVTAS